MTSQTNKNAPYFPPDYTLIPIRKFRERMLPEKITPSMLIQLGVNENGTGFSLMSLRFLRLVDQDNKPTPDFQQLVRATPSEYPEMFAQILRKVYSDFFSIYDPATASDEEYQHAFRTYDPHSQRSRMIHFFRAMCREAGLLPSDNRTVIKRSRNGTTVRPSVNASKTQPATSNDTPSLAAKEVISENLSSNIGQYALIYGLIDKLPSNAEWETVEDQEEFLQLLNNLIRFHVKVKKKDNQKDMQIED